jgi:hypothetical protein
VRVTVTEKEVVPIETVSHGTLQGRHNPKGECKPGISNKVKTGLLIQSGNVDAEGSQSCYLGFSNVMFRAG